MLEDYFDWILDAEAAADAHATEHQDDTICEYCRAYGHTEETCEVLEDDKLIVADDQARRAAQFFGLDVEDEDEPDISDWIAVGDGWLQDNEGNSFTDDPNDVAYDTFGDELKCHCDEFKAYECGACGVGRQFSYFKWRPYRDDHNYEVYNMGRKNRRKKWQERKQERKKTSTAPGKRSESLVSYAPKQQNKTTTTTKATQGTLGGYTPKDSHFADPYTTYDGSLTFYLTSSRAGGNTRKEGEFVPDWGLYFDWGWHPWWRAEHIAWPDYNVPTAWDVAFEQLTVAIEKASAGLKVEMGCIGAHGRTGTALAAINVILGCSAKEAIDHVRENHCQHAIESNIQEWWVEWVESQVTGKPCREQPERKPKYSGATSYSYGGGGYSTAATTPAGDCTQQAHFDMWLWLPVEKDNGPCPRKGEACKWWEQDVNNFYKGKFIDWAGAEYKKTSAQGTQVIRGYRVPVMAYGKGNVVHNATKAAKNDCWCDVCRYLEKGYGALLRPEDMKDGTAWDNEMWEIELEAKKAVAKRKLLQVEAFKAKVTDPYDGETIKIATHNGEIIEVNISDDFEPKPPLDQGAPKHGEKRGEYTYLNGQGWVWNALASSIGGN